MSFFSQHRLYRQRWPLAVDELTWFSSMAPPSSALEYLAVPETAEFPWAPRCASLASALSFRQSGPRWTEGRRGLYTARPTVGLSRSSQNSITAMTMPRMAFGFPIRSRSDCALPVHQRLKLLGDPDVQSTSFLAFALAAIPASYREHPIFLGVVEDREPRATCAWD